MKPITTLSKLYTPAKIVFFAGAFACLVFVGAARAEDGQRDSGGIGGNQGEAPEVVIVEARDSGGIGGVDAVPEQANFRDLGKCEQDRHPDHPGSCQTNQ